MRWRRGRARLPRQAVAVRRPRGRVQRRGRQGGADARRGRPAFQRHAELLVDFFGEENRACRDIRKHVAWYFKGYAVGGELRAALATSSSLDEIADLLAQLDGDQPYPGADAEGQRGRAGPRRCRACPTAGSTAASCRRPTAPSSPKPSWTPVGDSAGAVLPPGYDEADSERWLPEQHSRAAATSRATAAGCCTPAPCDGSPSRRRCSARPPASTSPAPADHSLEVAQVGRELAVNLGLDPDVVDAACLAHDLGHPPSDTTASARWRLGARHRRIRGQRADPAPAHPARAQGVRADGRPTVNLTRASLDAGCKYPWPGAGRRTRAAAASSATTPTIRSVRLAAGRAPEAVRCIEAQVMDLSDDIAYSVHDFEDAIVSGYLDVPALSARPTTTHWSTACSSGSAARSITTA